MTHEAYSEPAINLATPSEQPTPRPLISVDLFTAIRELPAPASSITDLPRDKEGNIRSRSVVQQAAENTPANPFLLTPADGTSGQELDAVKQAQEMSGGKIKVISPDDAEGIIARRTQLMGDFTDQITYSRNLNARALFAQYFKELGLRPSLVFEEYWLYGLRPEDTGNIANILSPDNHYWKNFGADTLKRKYNILNSAENAEKEAPRHQTVVMAAVNTYPHNVFGTAKGAQDIVRLGSMDNARAGIFYEIQGVKQKNASRRLMVAVARPALNRLAQASR